MLDKVKNPEELRRLLDRAVAASSNGILITDPTLDDNPIIYVNPAFERTTGYSIEEVLGRNCRFLQNADREQPELEEVRRAIDQGRECKVVLRNYRKDGAQFWNELYISPVFDEGGRLINFVGVQNDITERKRAEEERDLLLAREQLARAEAVAARRRLSFLAEADAVLLASLDYPERLRRISRLAVPELADWCLMDVLREDGSVDQLAASHTDPEREGLLRELQRLRTLNENAPGSVAEVLRSGRSMLVQTVDGDLLERNATSPEHLEILRELEPRSAIIVPLLARGKTLGAMTLVSSNPDRIYQREDLSLAESLAYRCALAVDNSRLYSERGQIARTLQRSLLPSLPEVESLEIGVEYLPVGEQNEAGGDFYDLIGDEGRWLAVIGDVRGKGASAAAVTALARYTIRAVAMREGSPSRILSDLNEAMLRQLHDYQFCTISCASLETAGGSVELTAARAGHPSPLVLRAGGTVEKMFSPGRVLGIFANPGLRERTVRLDSGDAAVFYTDGITEARAPDGALFGEERLLELLASCAGATASDIAAELKEAATRHGGGNPRDDVAVLVLKVK